MLLAALIAALLASAESTRAGDLPSIERQLPDVATINPEPATKDQLAGGNLFPFVVDHGTTHYAATSGAVYGSLLRWRGGRAETICPTSVGLDSAKNDFIVARIRAVASYVGAPVHTDSECKTNVYILFTAEPQTAMKTVLDWGAKSLGVRFPHQMDRELEISSAHTVQGWYVTAGGGSSVLNRDPGLIGGIELQGFWPRVIPTSLRDIDVNRSILSVIVVVDTSKNDLPNVIAMADYIAMVTLTLVQNPDHCDALPSVLDIMAPSCRSRGAAYGLTAGDIAFLKALYYRNTGLGKTPSRNDIVTSMTAQLGAGQP